MTRPLTRRTLLGSTLALAALPAWATEDGIWSADRAAEALAAGALIMLDVRTREEWAETGLAAGAWPVSMHEQGFETRLFRALEMAGDAPVALICATGGRTGFLMRALGRGGHDGFVDVSEGMMGNERGPGWLARGLPVVDVATALEALPDELR